MVYRHAAPTALYLCDSYLPVVTPGGVSRVAAPKAFGVEFDERYVWD